VPDALHLRDRQEGRGAPHPAGREPARARERSPQDREGPRHAPSMRIERGKVVTLAFELRNARGSRSRTRMPQLAYLHGGFGGIFPRSRARSRARRPARR
jgi:hypothetical protein